MPITALPSLDRTSVNFKADVDTFFGSQLPTFSIETEAARADIVIKQGQAAASAAAASASEGAALASKNAASASEGAATTAKNAAQAAQNAAEAALDSFDDRYLGAKATAPTLDNDGAALITGALYWDTVLNGGCLRVWQGAWVTIPANVASAISNTPAGNIAATTVQAAINELDAEKAKVGANSDITSLAALASINGGQLAGRRNYFLNGALAIFQRGNVTTAAGGSAYTADMMHVTASAGLTCQVAQGDYGATLGPRGTRYNANITFAGTGVAGSSVRLMIEDMTRFSAGSFTFSADMSTTVDQTVTIICRQHFGAGGSASVDTSVTQALTGATTLVSKTFALPSIAGKTLGVGHHLEIIVVTGVANGNTIYMSSMQLEAGAVATAFERTHPGDDLNACRRYFEAGKGIATVLPANLSRAALGAGNEFKVTKRAVPAMVYTSTIVPTANSISAYDSSGQVVISVPPGVSVDGLRDFVQTATAMQTGICYTYTWTAAADLVP